MTLGAPQFLLLLPLLAVVGWYFPRLALWRPLRIVLLLLFVFALTDPQIERKGRGIDLWVLIDRSLSAESIVDRDENEWRRLLERSRPSRHDRLHFVDFASEVSPGGSQDSATFAGDRSATRLALALRDTAARARTNRHNRILLFTDGFSTEPLAGTGERLVRDRIPLDYRLLRLDESVEYRVASFALPERVQAGEPFLLDITVAGQPAGDVPYTVFRGDSPMHRGTVTVKGGVARVRLSDRVLESGAHHYTVRIDPEDDALPGNNTFSRWIEIASGPRILLVTRYPDDPLTGILQNQGFEVRTVTDTLALDPGMLAGARSVLFHNVPAHEVPNDFLDAIAFYVTGQGGGFAMIGGKTSFGSGGYYESAIDELLPVTMELKSEHRKLAVAMAIVLDRSGSMAAVVESGHTKMALANEGSARAVELLGAMDAVTVFAVDSAAHQIAPLLNVGRNRARLESRIRSIESMGGGIFVYTGLEAAWKELQKATLGQRHIILFSDAADSEEPGQYKELLAEMKERGSTVSVIGLGNRQDPDSALLEDIAQRGGGRIFFSQNAGDLPNIFAQETVTVARSTFIEESTTTAATGAWYEIASRNLDWLPAVGGYNLSYLRSGDTASLISGDAYEAPLVATGRRGIGRTAAVSFPLGGDFSAESREWSEAADFVQTLNRWLMGDATPPGIGMRHELAGTELRVDLLFDSDDWAARFAERPPRILLNRSGEADVTNELTWSRLAPGHYSVRTQLAEGEVVRGAVQVGETALPLGPLSVGTQAEWAFDPERIEELRAVALETGGRERLDLGDAWERPDFTSRQGILPWILALLVPLFVLETLVTRAGWHVPEFVARRVRLPRRSIRKPSPPPAPVSPPEPESESAAAPTPETSSAERRRDRFARAKKGR